MPARNTAMHKREQQPRVDELVGVLAPIAVISHSRRDIARCVPARPVVRVHCFKCGVETCSNFGRT